MNTYTAHLVTQARHLARIEARYGDDFNPRGGRLYDVAAECVLKDAEVAGCFEEVWEALLPPSDAASPIRGLRYAHRKPHH